jgi:hypothetical protein
MKGSTNILITIIKSNFSYDVVEEEDILELLHFLEI